MDWLSQKQVLFNRLYDGWTYTCSNAPTHGDRAFSGFGPLFAPVWLMASLKKHSDLGAWLMFVKDTSMSDKAMRIFSSDMGDLGRNDLAREISEHQCLSHSFSCSLLSFVRALIGGKQ
jgi:hypothetical protein